MTMLEQLQALLREFTGERRLTITADTPLRSDLGLDSYDMASLMGLAEERFDVIISDRDVLNMLTAGDIADYIEQRAGK